MVNADNQHGPRVLPSFLPFFRDFRWIDGRGRVFEVDDTVAPNVLFRRLTKFMRWDADERRQQRMQLSEDLADYVDAANSTVEQMRVVLRRYSERGGEVRWTDNEIDAMDMAACKRAIKKDIHVNIYHFTADTNQQFGSYALLKAYTLAKRSRRFPLEAAREKGLTKLLLKNFTGRQGEPRQNGGEDGLSTMMSRLAV